MRQTGEHFVRIPSTLNPRSSSVCLRPFALPAAVVFSWGLLRNSAQGLFIGITVFFCFLCPPPLDLFMSNAQRASGPSDAALRTDRIQTVQHNWGAPLRKLR